jgi:hypothetical protein
VLFPGFQARAHIALHNSASGASFSGHSKGHAGEPATTHHTMVQLQMPRITETVQTVWTVQLNIWVPGRT